MQPIREFLVRPALPEPLSRLSELASNVLWSWEPIMRAVFRRLDPPLWRECGYNPVLMLGRIPQSVLARAAEDPRYLSLYAMACRRYDLHVKRIVPQPDGKLVAYFSAEYGLTECLPIYSGGLGILSGDHLKSSCDSGLPLVGVGLMYQHGYFRQVLNPDGWQQERYPVNDFYTLPVSRTQDASGQDLKVQVRLPAGPVVFQVWQIGVGRTKLYLLDTNIADNLHPADRDITDSLYGGDADMRIRQEIVLGIGGIRTLRALGLEPTVYHINEGHSAFLVIERIRLLMEEQRLSFDEALEASRLNNVFTTHTSVPAGIDLFDPGLMYHYFSDYCREGGIGFDEFMALGRNNPADKQEPFSMAILALKASAHRNAVSRLHRQVSQEMWHRLWPQLPVWEVPISSVTNGVHLPSWLNGDLGILYDQYLQPDWRDRFGEPGIWDQVKDIPDEELLEAHRRRKRRLITFIRARQQVVAMRRGASSAEIRMAGEVLDPHAFIIGFARRFATYKRATLLFRDPARLKKILTNQEMPVQIIIAGKAHPQDLPGKQLIRDIVQLSRDPELWKHLVFLEDYDIKIGRELVQAVDLWVNTPKRGQEACGTSGMKAAMNGVLNLSILDGWYDEAFENTGGWSIGEREPYSEDQDALHASEIYHLLENEIVPLFYRRGDQDPPREWMERVKQSLRYASTHFDCRRMVKEYDAQFYEPAHLASIRMARSNYELARERVAWDARIRQVWDRVNFVETGPAPASPVLSGRPVPIRAAVELAGLAPQDVRVEAVVGRVSPAGSLEETEVMVLPPVEQQGSVAVFSRELLPERTGRLGYALRVSPNHFDDPMGRSCPSLLKWG
ncbi:MAG: glycosyltransferase family 1 protein [Acidobacteria bacterium]|nr:glycosyltransferase family 1 protein [Acidobacteriota bacterium]